MTTLASSSPSPQIELTDLVTGPENELFIDSRIVAAKLDVNHSDWVQDTVKKYQTQLEQEFGILRFQTGEIKGKGQPEKFVYLTEDQALFLLTLSRNSRVVVQCEANLVKTFAQARRDLEGRNKPQETIKLPTDLLESLKLLVVVETERKALAAANEKLQAATAELQAVNAELAPKAEAADILLGVHQAVTFQEAAQVMGIPNIGRNNLFKALVELKLIIDTQHPYQKYVDQGIFVVRETQTNWGIIPQILITQKGLQYIIPLLKEHGMKSSKIIDRVADSFRLTPKAI
jgi:phage antirepressor YoqD-like protein